MIATKVSLGISTLGNMQALQLCLMSVLNATTLPASILVRFEGELPSFGNFYFEQISDIARLKNVRFTFTRAKSQGVRYARDWQMDHCETPYLWQLDDDVVPLYHCLEGFILGIDLLGSWSENWGYLAGIKVDVNNRRQYPDFDHKKRDNGNFSQNHFAPRDFKPVRLQTLDAGNVVLNLPLLREKQIRFSVFADAQNAGGEDDLFAHVCQSKGAYGYLCTAAQSLHLEKEKVVFTERAARAQMLQFGKELYDLRCDAQLQTSRANADGVGEPECQSASVGNSPVE